MIKYKIGDIAEEISIRENDPANCSYDKFVGLEHYVSGDVEIHNYGSTEKLSSAMKAFQAGDILIARRNVYLRRASVVNFDGLTSGDSIVLRVKDEILAKILPFVLNSDSFWDFADQYSDGTMSKRLSPKMLKQFEFELPDKEEQEKYAKLLWAAYRTKRSYEKLLVKIDELVKSQFIEMFGDTENNPRKLEMKAWKDIFETTTGKLDSNAMVDGGEYPFFTCAKEAYWIDKYAFDCEALLLAGNNAVGVYDVKYYNGKFNAYQRTYVLQLKEKGWSYEFFKNQLEMKLDYLRENSIGSNTRYLTLKILGDIKFLVPDIENQREWADFIRQTDKSKFEIKQAIDSLNATIRALVQKNS